VPTKIDWTDETWNPGSGCTPVSEGCRSCWARTQAEGPYLRGKHGYDAVDPFQICLHPDRFTKKHSKYPGRFKKPKKIAVWLMGDIFHEDVPFEWVIKTFEHCASYPQHIYQFLTKRPHREAVFRRWYEEKNDVTVTQWPDNFWFGATIENQKRADERIPFLLQIPAKVIYVSLEPMLENINLRIGYYRCACGAWELEGFVHKLCADCGKEWIPPRNVDWVIVGGESGNNARPAEAGWVRNVLHQCAGVRIPFFFKQWGTGHYRLDGGAIDSVRDRECGVYHGGRRDGEPKGGHVLDGETYQQFPA